MGRKQTLISEQVLISLKEDPEGTLTEIFTSNRPGLRRMVATRMDRSLKGRVDPSDILQETLIDACQRLNDYLANPTIPFLKWLFILAEQNTVEAHRRHVAAQKRSTRREQRPDQSGSRAVSSDLQAFAVSGWTGPLQRVENLERTARLQQAISMLSLPSQTVVRMRFLEGRPLAEISEELGISVDAVAKRAMRSLLKLTDFAGELGLGGSD